MLLTTLTFIGLLGGEAFMCDAPPGLFRRLIWALTIGAIVAFLAHVLSIRV
jgi:hypothetical protein